MTITLPAGASFLDVEQILCDILGDITAGVTPQPQVVTWLPTSYGEQLARAPFIVVQRVGGGAPGAGVVDTAICEVGVLAERRSDAWQLLDFVRAQLLSGSSACAAWPGPLVIAEQSGPVMPPFINPDHRYVRALFELRFRRPR